MVAVWQRNYFLKNVPDREFSKIQGGRRASFRQTTMTESHRDSSMPHQESTDEPGLAGRLTAEQVAEIYGVYHRELLAFLLGVLRDGHLARDALQQTFRRVAEAGDAAREESLRGWLFQVAFREALQLRRSEIREQRRRQSLRDACREAESGGHPADSLVSREQRERLQAAVQELPAEQRVVVQSRIQTEETFAEIAGRLRLPLGTVLTRMRLAVEQLRKRLSDE